MYIYHKWRGGGLALARGQTSTQLLPHSSFHSMKGENEVEKLVGLDKDIELTYQLLLQ